MRAGGEDFHEQPKISLPGLRLSDLQSPCVEMRILRRG
jgi:hypothetical protein